MKKILVDKANYARRNVDFEKLHYAVLDRLETSYKNVALVTSNGNKIKVQGGRGYSRRAQDAPLRKMTPTIMMNCASNSKPITAAAVLKSLWHTSKASLSTPMYTYLPSHWNIQEDVKKITFEDLLGFRSGFKKEGSGTTYEKLKLIVAIEPESAPGAVREYKNIDYALFRLILPRLSNFKYIGSDETAENNYLSTKYKELVFNSILSPSGIGLAGLKNEIPGPEMLRYSTATTQTKGKGSGNWENLAGSTGWFLTCADLARFYSSLWYTDKLLPQWIRDKMFNDLLGYDSHGTVNGVDYATKGGRSHGGNWGYRSRFVGFKNGISMVVYANNGVISGKPSATTIIKEEFDNLYTEVV